MRLKKMPRNILLVYPREDGGLKRNIKTGKKIPLLGKEFA